MIYLTNPNNNRFYLLRVGQDIFNYWVLSKTFGGLYNNYRRTLTEAFDTEQQAWDRLTEIESHKRQRGYIYSDFEEHFTLRPQNHFEIKPCINKPTPTKPKTTTIQPHPNQLKLF